MELQDAAPSATTPVRPRPPRPASRKPRKALLGDAFLAACAHGHLGVAQYLADVFDVTPEDARAGNNIAVHRALLAGHRGVVEWLADRFGINPRAGCDLLSACCAQSDSVETVRWLVERFGYTATDVRSRCNQTLRSALLHSHCDVAALLADKFELGKADVLDNDCEAFHDACMRGDTATVAWILERFSLAPSDLSCLGRTLTALAAQHPRWAMADFLVARFGLTKDDVMQLLPEKPHSGDIAMTWLDHLFPQPR
jgi:hypothetical protein